MATASNLSRVATARASSARSRRRRSRDSATMTSTRATRVSRFADDYDVWLLDQFGLLHDGSTPYDGAVECVDALAAMGKRIYIVSNSSRGREGTIARLASMGFSATAFRGAMTSGEVARRFATRDADDWRTEKTTAMGDNFRRLRRAIDGARSEGRRARAAHLTWSARGAITLGEETNARIEIVDVSSADDAGDANAIERVDFVLAHGTEAIGRGDGKPCETVDEETMRALVERAAAAKVPLCVANPDFVTVSGETLVAMPGTLARYYVDKFNATHAGEDGEAYVCLMGKPSSIIYEELLWEIKAAGGDLDKSRVVAVGDSLAHDVTGGARAGVDTVFVRGVGVHAAELKLRALEDVLREHPDATPTHVIERFAW
jgi:ribonucleotide monophosphatase NagD (HAD superfamily)